MIQSTKTTLTCSEVFCCLKSSFKESRGPTCNCSSCFPTSAMSDPTSVNFSAESSSLSTACSQSARERPKYLRDASLILRKERSLYFNLSKFKLAPWVVVRDLKQRELWRPTEKKHDLEFHIFTTKTLETVTRLPRFQDVVFYRKNEYWILGVLKDGASFCYCAYFLCI